MEIHSSSKNDHFPLLDLQTTTEFERTKRNVHATILQRTWEIQVQTYNAVPGEILHNQRKSNS
jgi:hypothetical protein